MIDPFDMGNIKGLYTIIVDYRDGTYISQFEADTPKSAVQHWSRSKPSDRKDVPSGPRSYIHSELLNGNDLVPLSGLKNVWCLTATYRDQLLLINVVLAHR